jgi:putative flippase GtrA
VAVLARKRWPVTTDHPLPQPVELPIDERASNLPLRTQLVRFVLTGGLSAIVDFGLLVILMHLGLGHTPAKALSFVAGTTTAYLINRRWTFRAEPSKRRFLAVVVLYAVTFALQVGLFSVLFTALTERGLSRLTVQVVGFVIAQGVATTVNFIVQRAVIFRLR